MSCCYKIHVKERRADLCGKSETRIERLQDVFLLKGHVKEQLEVWKLEHREHERNLLENRSCSSLPYSC